MGYIVSNAHRSLWLDGSDGLLYQNHSAVTEFKTRQSARNAIKRNIRARIKSGFDDQFASTQCYSIRSIEKEAP